MADGFIQVPGDGKGKKMRTTVTTVDSETVHQEVVQVVDENDIIISPSTEAKQDTVIAKLTAGIPLIANDDTVVAVQNPLPTDGDSIYPKDIDLAKSSLGTFTGNISDIANGVSAGLLDAGVTSPKHYTIYFNRPITTTEITIASQIGKDFSNAKLYLYDVAGNVLLTIDNSADNTKYTKYVFSNVPQTFIGYKIEFYTTDEVGVAFNYIRKSSDVNASVKALDVDTGLLSDINAVSGNLGVITHREALSENHVPGSSIHTIIGANDALGSTFQILAPEIYTQPPDEVAMEIVSASGDDTLGGTGVEKVVIVYFDKSVPWVRNSEIVDLAGVTPVALSNIDVYRIQSMTGVGGVASGEITLRPVGGGVTYGTILAGASIMERCVFYVRAGYRAVVTDIILGCTTGGGIRWRLFKTVETDSITTPTGHLSIRSADTTFSATLTVGIYLENPLGHRYAIGIAAEGKVVNQEGEASVVIYEELIT